MFSKSGLAALTIAISAFTVVPTRSAVAAPSDDACALVTQAQVSAVLGVSMGAGSHVTPTFVKTCTWTATGGDTKGVRILTISLQPGDSFAGAKNMMEMAQATAGAKRDRGAAQLTNASVSGIGDDAFYTSMGSGYTALLVKKGETAFKVAIYGAVPAAEARAREKQLALDVLSKL